MMSSAYLARSSFALTVAILASSSLPLASACPLRPWRATNSSLILRHLAIAVEELVAVLKGAVLSELWVVVDAVELGFEANSEEEDLYAGPTLIWKAKMGETCW